METGLITHEPQESTQAMTVQQIHQHIQLIQQVMENEMRDGEHYGKIPGCGDKPVLLKAGAEKLCLLFKMASRFKVENVDLGNGHREVRITTELYHIESGKFLGEGLGSCSTMESKYRYRGSEVELTGEVVPKEYWKNRDPELIGGKQFTTKKVDGQWMIGIKGEKMENPDIADVYNTVLKIGKKRSQVDAVLTVTAASDIFTQDMEEVTTEAAMKANQKVSEPERNVPQETPHKQVVELLDGIMRLRDEGEGIGSAGLPGLPREINEKVAGIALTYSPPEAQDELQGLYAYLRKKGQTEEVALSSLRECFLSGSPQGLLEAIGGGVVVPPRPPRPAQKPQTKSPVSGPAGEIKRLQSQFSGSTCSKCGKKIQKGEWIIKEPGSTVYVHESH